jgi:hypothetical protein
MVLQFKGAVDILKIMHPSYDFVLLLVTTVLGTQRNNRMD